MKPNFFTLALVLFFNFLYSSSTKPFSLSATITGGTTVCQNAAAPQVTFTGSGGTAPYTFVYKINGGADISISSTGTNAIIAVGVNTSSAGVFTYSLVSVSDSATPVISQNVSGSAILNILFQPNANMGGTGGGSEFNNFPVFRVCVNSVSTFNFTNTSTTIGTNSNYTINWGDGTPNFTGNTWNTLTHTYQVGLWYLTYTILGNNGCSITRTFIVFVGSNPAVSLGNPGNTDICNANSLTFPITGTSNNPPGTTYLVTFNDGSPPIPFNHPPPSSVTHTFLTSSCNVNSSDGSNTYANSFFANIVATNPCSTSSVGVVPIYVSASPQANFTIPATACTNAQVCLTNTSLGNQVISNTCSPPSIIWNITPSTGFSLLGGSSLGNSFGSDDSNLWLSGSEILCLNFSVGGTYTIKMRTGNKCGINEITKTICVQPALTPLFTLSNNSGCAPFAVTATNTTNLANQCQTPTYLWEVTYAPGFCGTSAPAIPNQTTQNASFNFTEAGIYTISLKTTNSCGTNTVTQTVEVKKPPVISINPIADSCTNLTISPTATIPTCATTASGTITYAWSFPGGNPSAATTANPGTISYGTPGNYTVSLMVTNSCGASNTATQTFTINPTPVVTNTVLAQSICSGTSTSPIILAATPTGATFSWTATATAGISGFTTSGTTSTIPAQNISTTNASSGTVTYTITPSIGLCVGTPVNYVITVIPAPTITTQPAPSTVCLNGTVPPLTVVVNSSSGTPTYQWFSNLTNSNTGGTSIAGATSSTYNPPTSTVGSIYYYCVIALPAGGCSSLTSSTALVNVVALPSITTQPLASQNVCVGVSIANPLSIIATGGTGVVSYQWFSNTTNSTTGGTAISGATASTYSPLVFTTTGTFYYYATATFSGTNCGNVTSEVAAITVFADPTTTQPLVSQNVCQDATPTSLEVIPTGGNGTFSYQWFSNGANNTTSGTLISGATNATFNPPTNAVGTLYYYCVITQSTLGCSVTSATSAVIVSQSPSVSIQPTSSTACLGGTVPALSVSISNGAGTPTYQWFSNTANNTTTGTLVNGETNPTFTPPTSIVGTLYYYCAVTFSAITGACSTVSTTTSEVIITPGATINQNPEPTQSLCVGATIQNPLTVTFNGGTGTPSYQWFINTSNSNSGGTLISGATSNTYTPPVFTTAGTTYFYVEISFSGSGCGAIKSAVAEIIVVPDPIITAQPLIAQTLCQNATPSALSVTPSGGIANLFLYQWYSSLTNTNSGGTLILGATTDNFLPPTDVVGTNFYYCEITQQNGLGCNVSSTTAAVIVNPAPAINIQPQDNTYCVNQSSNQLTVSFSNGTGTPNYQWFSNTVNSNSGGTLLVGEANSTFTPSTALAGTFYYYVVITFPEISGGCEIITSNAAMITINPFPIMGNESQTICSNNAFLIVPTDGNGNEIPTGTTYTWLQPTVNPAGALTGFSAENAPQTQISQTLINSTNNPATITYIVTPTAGICDGATFTVTITVNPSINPNVIVNNNACFGVNNASISTNITGGIPPYVISWVGPSGFSSNATTISNIEPGTYTITIDDAGNCPFTNSYTITQPDDIVIITNSQTNSTCFESNNGTIDLTITGGTGAYSYSWTKDTLPFATTQDLANLSPGIYTVTFTDENNCGPKTQTFTITEPPLLVVSLVNQTNIDCFGAATGAINVNVTGGTNTTPYLFSWTGPNGFTSSNQNVAALFAGTYNLTVTDNNGCQKSLSVTLSQSTEIIITFTTTEITCYGANDATFTTTISGGIAPYTFTWNNLSTVLNQNNLSAGNYTITVTDNLGCVKTATVNITEAPIFTVNPVVQNVTCFGANNGSINVNLVGGIAPVTLTWSDGSTAGLTRNNLAPGTYTATITDSKPCVITRTFIIVQPQPLVLSANLTNPTNCNNASSGAIDLIVSGGTAPFTYAWSNGFTSEDVSDLVAGNYTVTVIDANGCSVSGQYSLIRPEPIAIVVNTQTDFDCETREVTQNFVAQASGGIPPFTYQWSSGNISGANNEIMNTETNGTVVLTVFDSLGCSQIYTVNVDNPVIGTTTFETISTSFTSFGFYSINDPIQFTSTITGDYESIFWDFGDGTFSSDVNPIHTYTIPQDYAVTQTVTYPFGCVYKNTIILKIEKGYLLVIPSGFTPNNDSVNESFRPVAKNLKNIVLEIYDSWGSMIYSEKADVIKGWDGKIKGFNAENGNYYSKVTAETFYGTIIYENQTFVLIK